MRNGRDDGSVTMLMPACVLVVLVLASIAVDMTLVHLRQRQAFDAAAAAANDAVVAGVDPDGLRAGTYRLDPARVRRLVGQAIDASEVGTHLAAPPKITVDADTVAIVLEVEADYLFTAAMPGAPDGMVVTARASATAVAP